MILNKKFDFLNNIKTKISNILWIIIIFWKNKVVEEMKFSLFGILFQILRH